MIYYLYANNIGKKERAAKRGKNDSIIDDIPRALRPSPPADYTNQKVSLEPSYSRYTSYRPDVTDNVGVYDKNEDSLRNNSIALPWVFSKVDPGTDSSKTRLAGYHDYDSRVR